MQTAKETVGQRPLLGFDLVTCDIKSMGLNLKANSSNLYLFLLLHYFNGFKINLIPKHTVLLYKRITANKLT